MGQSAIRVLLELDSSDVRIGAVNDALDLAQYLRPFGVQVLFTGVIEGEFERRARALSIPVVSGRSRMLSRSDLPTFSCSLAAWLAKLLWLRPDVVHLNYSGYAPSLAMAAHLTCIPVVARAGAYDPHAWANRWTDAYAANGEAHAAALRDSPLATRVYIAGDLFRPDRLAGNCTPERPIPQRTANSRFLFLGQLVQRKGLHVLIEAFSFMRERADLLLVGGDWSAPGLPQSLRRLAEDLGLQDRVHFENHRSDVGALLRDCDVLVLPSLSEARPRCIIEALFVGRPVVASRVGGIPSLVSDGVTGLLVPPGDAAELASALDRMAASPDLRARLGDAALARARADFDPEKTAKRYSALYRSLATERGLPQCA